MGEGYGFHTTAEEVARGLDLSGRTIVVTGGSAGLGVEAMRVLAARGAKVVGVVRDRAKGEAALGELREKLRTERPDADLELAELDLADLDSVRRGGDEIARRFPRIDRLINNAGVMACPLGRTREGLDLQLGTNHLGHFVLAARLIESLRAGAPAPIVNLSSGGHRLSPMRFDDPFFEREDYDKWVAYGQAKTANVLFSVALDARERERGVRCFAVHPGAIMTELARHLEPDDIKALMARSSRSRKLEYKNVHQGAATTVWAATAPELDDRGGVYCEDCGIAPVIDDPAADQGVMSWAVDPAAAEQLWSLSEKWSGERFPV